MHKRLRMQCHAVLCCAVTLSGCADCSVRLSAATSALEALHECTIYLVRLILAMVMQLWCYNCCADLAAGVDDEESGWKYIHGDVFRFPPGKSVFCAFVGTGTQVRKCKHSLAC